MHTGWKEKWITALRSGEFKQGQNHLKQENGAPRYCCLGVLCEIHPDVSWIASLHGGKRTMAEHKNERSGTALTSQFRDALSISDEHIGDLIDLNDGMGTYDDNRQSFEQIADYIEEKM